MKIIGSIHRPDQKRRKAMAGQILAEAAIGSSLMILVWLLYSYVSYISTNRIRADMGARYSAWLSGNGVDPTANNGAIVINNVYLTNDVALATVATAKNPFSVAGISLPSIPGISPGDICSNSVTFGLAQSQVSGTSRFPFNLMNAKIPFMPSTMLTNFTIVTGHAAWPADVSQTDGTGSVVYLAILAIGAGLDAAIPGL